MIPNASKIPVCFQCGSTLIEVSKITSHPEGSLFPQTTAIYRCSNQDCQDQKDRDEVKRLKLQLEKQVADQKRAEDKQKAYDLKVQTAIGKEEKT